LYIIDVQFDDFKYLEAYLGGILANFRMLNENPLGWKSHPKNVRLGNIFIVESTMYLLIPWQCHFVMAT
jgi:hypothetical protein